MLIVLVSALQLYSSSFLKKRKKLCFVQIPAVEEKIFKRKATFIWLLVSTFCNFFGVL